MNHVDEVMQELWNIKAREVQQFKTIESYIAHLKALESVQQHAAIEEPRNLQRHSVNNQIDKAQYS